MPICKEGEIKRTSFSRKSYTRKNGHRVRRAQVASTCVKDLGAKGKWTNTHKNSGIGPLKPGRLSKFGYTSSKPISVRHEALNKAVKAYGALAVYKMLNAVYVYTKRTSPALSALYKGDRNYIGAKHGYKST
jgi:hypothetical protein